MAGQENSTRAMERAARPPPNLFSGARRVTDLAGLFVSSSNLLFILFLSFSRVARLVSRNQDSQKKRFSLCLVNGSIHCFGLQWPLQQSLSCVHPDPSGKHALCAFALFASPKQANAMPAKPAAFSVPRAA